MAGKYKIPMESYYSKSKSIHSKVNKTKNDANKLLKLVSSSGLSGQDMEAIKSSEGYHKGKQAVKKLETKYLKKLSKMSSEGSSNPMNPIVETDKNFAAKFQAATGANAPGVSSAIHAIDVQVDEKVVKDEIAVTLKGACDSDTYKRIMQILDKCKPGEAMVKLLKDKKIMAIVMKDPETRNKFLKAMDMLRKAHLAPGNALMKALGKSGLLEKMLKGSKDEQLKACEFLGKLRNGNFKILDKSGKIMSVIDDLSNKKIPSVLFDKIKDLAGETKVGSAVVGKISKTAECFGEKAFGKLGKGAVGVMGFDYAKSAISDFESTHDLGKSLTGAVVDTVSDIGPVEGAMMGAEFGPLGMAIGAGIGLGIQFYKGIDPKGFDKVKSAVYKATGKVESGVSKAAKFVKKKFKEGKIHPEPTPWFRMG